MQTDSVIEPPERERVSDWAHRQIRAAILRGLRRPGDRLSIPALAAELGVSRSPVREAVQQLVREGLAAEEPHRGAVVARVDAEKLRGVYAVREVLEGLAARDAAEVATPADLDELEQLVAEHREAIDRGDMAAHVDLDMRFHRTTRLLSGNDVLVGFLDQIQGQIQLAMLTTSVRAGAEHALHDHEHILAAIRFGDADAAEAAARSHVTRLRQTLHEADSDTRDEG